MKRGQYFSFDALMATLILVIAIALLSSYWFSVQNSAPAEEDAMQRRALAISDALLTSGNPPAWARAEDAKVFGLSYAENSSLSPAKISALSAYLLRSDANYNATCAKYSVQNFYVEVLPLDGSGGSTLGREPMNAAAQAIVTRVAVLDGKFVNVKVTVWAA